MATNQDLLKVDRASIKFVGILDGPNPSAQGIILTNISKSNLSWGAVGVDDINWLMVSPIAGEIKGGEHVNVTVAAIFPQDPIDPGQNPFNMAIDYGLSRPKGGAQAAEDQRLKITVPITFEVDPRCTIAGSLTTSTNFDSAANPNARLTLTASGIGVVGYDLLWTAFSTVSWLTINSNLVSTGTIHAGATVQASIVVDSTGLVPGNYDGEIVLSAVDSLNHQPVDITQQAGVQTAGTSQIIGVTLAVQPQCSLGLPSQSCLSFSAEAGTNPTLQSFTIGTDGLCDPHIEFSASADQSWLNVMTSRSTVIGGSVIVTVSVIATPAQPTKLLPGSYSGLITIHALDNGKDIGGSPQIVEASLNVIAAPALLVSPSSGLDFKDFVGKLSQPITIKNTGGEPLQWYAHLTNDAPDFVSLLANSGQIQGGASDSFNVLVNATGVTGNKTFSTSVVITATDPNNPSNQVAGSPVSVPITITITSAALFLTVMKQLHPPNSLVVKQTQQLFKHEDLTLNDLEIERLTKSWDGVVEVVASVAGPSTHTKIKQASGIPDKSLADLITLHNLLEQLYDRLESNVTRSDVEIIGQ